MITFEATMELRVTGPNRSDHFQRVVDAYFELEQSDPNLIDVAWGFADTDAHADVDVELTVTAEDEDEAYKLASDCVRTAIHAAGGFTPGWGERVDLGAPAYRVTEESIEPVLA